MSHSYGMASRCNCCCFGWLFRWSLLCFQSWRLSASFMLVFIHSGYGEGEQNVFSGSLVKDVRGIIEPKTNKKRMSWRHRESSHWDVKIKIHYFCGLNSIRTSISSSQSPQKDDLKICFFVRVRVQTIREFVKPELIFQALEGGAEFEEMWNCLFAVGTDRMTDTT